MYNGPESQWEDPFQSYEEAFQEFKFNSENPDQHQRDGQRNQRTHKKKPRSFSFHDFDDNPDEIDEDFDEFEDSKNRVNLATHLKELYRQLVRKLHPDHNPNPNSRQIELWHQVQEAYQNHELERLETLSVMSDMFNNSWDQIEGVSLSKNSLKNSLLLSNS